MKRHLTQKLTAGVLSILLIAGTAASDMTASAAETVTLNFTESTEIDMTACDCGYTSTAWIAAKPARNWSTEVRRYTLLLIGIGGYSSGMGGEDCDFDAVFFESLRATLQSARSNGAMVGIRFRYDDNGTTNPEPATFEQVLRHIEQIGESGLLTEYADVISFVETGMVGSWGEQWGGRYTSLAHKAQVLDAFLQIVPDPIPVTVRTPNTFRQWLADFCGVDAAAKTMGENVAAFLAEDTELARKAARVGMYNDGYMGSDSDLGTYSDRAGETDWLRFAPAYGGEFSGSDEWRMKYTTWQPQNAIPEMYRTRLTRINGNLYRTRTEKQLFATEADAQTRLSEIAALYDEAGLGTLDAAPTITKTDEGKYQASWSWFGYDAFVFDETLDKALGLSCDNSAFYGQNCWQFIRTHLGYRFVLRSLDMTAKAAAGDVFDLTFTVENTGFASPPSEKEVEVLLSNGRVTYTLPTAIAAQKWESATKTSEKIHTTLPKTMPGGSWNVYLRVSNPNDDPAYDNVFCTKFANCDMQYDAQLGANLIGTILVSGEADPETAPSPDCRPAGYYPAPQAIAVDESARVDLLDKSYTFTEDGHYGFTFLYKIEGITTPIQLGNWYDSFTIENTGYSSAYTTYGLNTMNLTLERDGCYALHLPFYGSAFNCTVPTAAGDSVLTSLTLNDSRNYWSEETMTLLGGSTVQITPIGFVEGGSAGYDVTFHLPEGDAHYEGSYGFTDEKSQTNRNIPAVTVMSLLKNHADASYTDRIGTWRLLGYTTKKGDAAGLIDENFIAIGKMELYPYYELDCAKTDLNAANFPLINGADYQGVRYVLDPVSMTAQVGDGSAWERNAGGLGENLCIPAAVSENGKTYTVTGIGANAFAGDTALRSISLPDSVVYIGANAFPDRIEVYGGSALLGDVNGDGELSLADAVLLQKWLLGLPDVILVNRYAGDLNGDGKLTAVDLSLVKALLVKIK